MYDATYLCSIIINLLGVYQQIFCKKRLPRLAICVKYTSVSVNKYYEDQDEGVCSHLKNKYYNKNTNEIVLPANLSEDIRWNSGSWSHLNIRLKVSRPDFSLDQGLGLRSRSDKVPCDRQRTRWAKIA